MFISGEPARPRVQDIPNRLNQSAVQLAGILFRRDLYDPLETTFHQSLESRRNHPGISPERAFRKVESDPLDTHIDMSARPLIDHAQTL